MTIEFPDVSQYTPNVNPAQYPAIIARATLSTTVADPTYLGFKRGAEVAGTVFAAYHWLNHGSLVAQAQWCFQHVGSGVPVMIDAEDVAGNTGYAGPVTVDDMVGFASEYRALGGIVSLVYLPFWYWSGAMGAPHRLGELEAVGLHLVSSNYPPAGYTDNGPGWAPYYAGAPTPVQWQFTSSPIDMNAFKGTIEEYQQLIGYNMLYVFSVTDGPVTQPGAIYAGTPGGGWYWVRNQTDYETMAAFAKPVDGGSMNRATAEAKFGPYRAWDGLVAGDSVVLSTGTRLVVE